MKSYMNITFYKLSKSFLFVKKKVFYVFLSFLTTCLLYANDSKLSPSNSSMNPASEIPESFNLCIFELVRLLELQELDLNNFTYSITEGHLEEIDLIVNNLIEKNQECSWLRRDTVYPDVVYPGAVYPDAVYPDAVYPDAVYPDAVYPDAVYPDAVYPDAVSTEDIESFLPNVQTFFNAIRGDHSSWFEGIMHLISDSACWLGNQCLEYSVSRKLASGLYDYAKLYYPRIENKLDGSEVYLEDKIVEDKIVEDKIVEDKIIEYEIANGTVMACFFEGRKNTCQYSALTGYVISMMTTAIPAYIGYRILSVDNINIPSTFFIIGGLANLSWSFSWWGLENTKYLLLGVQGLRSYLLFTNKQRKLFNSSNIFRISLAAYSLSLVINYIEKFHRIGYWEMVYNESPYALIISTSIATASLIYYLKKIHIPEMLMIMVGGNTSAYIVATLAALYGVSHEILSNYWHIIFAYGGMIVNSKIETNNIGTIISLLTQNLLYVFRYSYNLKSFVPDVMEELDAMRYFVFNIAIPTMFLFNIKL